MLNTITFNSATNLTSNSTLRLYNGIDCNATLIHSQSINAINDGDNSVVLNQPITVTENDTYYFSIKSDNNQVWRIRFNQNSEVAGNLRTYQSSSNTDLCNWSFTNFDWNFSLNIEQESANPEIIDLFIWAGQSNAQGWTGNAAQYPQETNVIDRKL